MEKQEEMFRKLVSEAMVPEKPVILHLRRNGRYGSDASTLARLMLGNNSVPQQGIHLHCFTGTQNDVHLWQRDFPNAHF